VRNRIRVAVIGGGTQSAVGRAHFSALNMDGLFDVTSGFFSRDIEKNELSNGMWNARNLVNDLTGFDVLRHEFDVALILTPTPTHFEIINHFVQLKIPVISEKSLVSSYTQGKRICELNKDNIPIYVTFNYTGYPMVRELRAKVLQGTYGEIHTVHIEMLQDSFGTTDSEGNPRIVQDWRTRDYEIPTVSLDLGVHVVNLFEFITGDQLQRVVGVETHAGLIANVVDNVHCLGISEKGIQSSLIFGKTFAGKKNGLRISLYGSRGAAHWFQEMPNELYEADIRGNTITLNYSSQGILEASKSRYMRFKVGHPIGFVEAFANLYFDIFTHFTQVGGNSHFIFQPVNALSGLATLSAIHESSKVSNWTTPIREHLEGFKV